MGNAELAPVEATSCYRRVVVCMGKGKKPAKKLPSSVKKRWKGAKSKQAEEEALWADIDKSKLEKTAVQSVKANNNAFSSLTSSVGSVFRSGVGPKGSR